MVADLEALRALLGPDENICVVGDDDQSIYGFRGANVELIRRFTEDFPAATVLPLLSNYRSSSEILGVANDVIAASTESRFVILTNDVLIPSRGIKFFKKAYVPP